MILFIDACVRNGSRTRRIARSFLSRVKEPITEVRLNDVNLPTVDEAFLDKRDRLIRSGSFDDPMFDLARQFAEADEIVVAAPFWDLSFPASLKRYFEQVNVIGVTFRYGEDGIPIGMCRAKKLTYITTAGGDFFPQEYGFGYVDALARNFYGINETRLIKAVGLDVEGADVEAILRSAEKAADKSNEKREING